MEGETLTQFVTFRTRASADDFDRRWRPVATGFSRAGLQLITLAQVSVVVGDGLAGVRFLSCNLWPAEAYRRVFPAGPPVQAGADGIEVTQPGVFHSVDAHTAPLGTAQPHRNLVVAFSTHPVPDTKGGGLTRALEGTLPDSASVAVYRTASPPGMQPYSRVVTVRTDPDDTPAVVETLRQVFNEHLGDPAVVIVSGREILTLPQEAGR